MLTVGDEVEFVGVDMGAEYDLAPFILYAFTSCALVGNVYEVCRIESYVIRQVKEACIIDGNDLRGSAAERNHAITGNSEHHNTEQNGQQGR